MGLPQTSRCSSLGTWVSRASRTPSRCSTSSALQCKDPRTPSRCSTSSALQYKDRLQDIFFVEVHTICVAVPLLRCSTSGGGRWFPDTTPAGVVTSRTRTVLRNIFFEEVPIPEDKGRDIFFVGIHTIHVAVLTLRCCSSGGSSDTGHHSRGGPHPEDEDRFRNIFCGGPHTRGQGSLGQGRSPPPLCLPPGLPLLGPSAPRKPSVTGSSQPRTRPGRSTPLGTASFVHDISVRRTATTRRAAGVVGSRTSQRGSSSPRHVSLYHTVRRSTHLEDKTSSSGSRRGRARLGGARLARTW